ncbi:uncharacterized protein LOC133424841 [Cololabis saira]|uniref:uncharacterized protein LOC133424841 n=1 Tax=Cololabis saira TaxID=129043 RepID=UPI002AD3D8E4|nr:uncharacterized protein LOC133424841 [Cololabis saira]
MSDLHQWISSFPFKADRLADEKYFKGAKPCHKYQRKLKEKAQKISKKFWSGNKDVFGGNKKPDLSYTSLVLDKEECEEPSKIKRFKSKKSKMRRPKKLKTYIPENKGEMSPGVLLKTHKNILLVGKPGIGKTAVICEMLRLWAESENEELDYMFYFDMREVTQMKIMTLEDLLFNAYIKPDEGKDEVLQDIEKISDNVTVMLDGVTDLSSPVLKKLVEGDLLPGAKIIITCRPDDEEDTGLDDRLRVEVKGFSEQAIKAYLSATLADEHKTVLSNVELLTLCHVPMYALMVAASFSSGVSPQPRTVTEVYINIVRFCLQRNSNKPSSKHLNNFIQTKSEGILSLAKVAFLATQGKTVNLEEVSSGDSSVLSFLKPLIVRVSPTKTLVKYAFLHYTVQEFFAALWLLKNPDQIKKIFQQRPNDEMKHMTHLIPFMCQLLNEENPSLISCLIPAQELQNTRTWFFKEIIASFFSDDVLFLCQCLYESQLPEACIDLLDKLDYCLDLSDQNLDSYHCCAVAYVISQSKEKKIQLQLEDVVVSEQGMEQLLRCHENVHRCEPLSQQLWKIFLQSDWQMDPARLLSLDRNQLHLPVHGERRLFGRAVEVINKMPAKVKVCLYGDGAAAVCQSLCESLFEALPNIRSLSLEPDGSDLHGGIRFLGNLFCAAAEREQQTGEKILQQLSSVCRHKTFPFNEGYKDEKHQCDVLLDLYTHMKDCETQTGFRVLPSFQSVFQSVPAVWTINLSERKTSILLEVLKLQSEKKPVKLRGCSHEDDEVRSFLQCLPYISQLSLDLKRSDLHEGIRFLGNLFCAAAEREQQTGEKILQQLSSVCRHETFPFNEGDMYQCDVLLDLYTHIKDYETQTGFRVLPSLQSVFQSAPAVWIINLSERKTSILLEVLKLQSEKKPVKLTDCSHEDGEVRIFLQCLPYISQLSLDRRRSDLHGGIRFLGNLFCAAAEREQQTGEKILQQLSSVCRYKTFPCNEGDIDDDDDYYMYRCDFLLDLCTHMKDCETKTGFRVLPSLRSVFQSVFQSAPAVLIINLSKRKTSILLEVLKLQSEKKPVKLRGCSHEDGEVRSFLQCLPYISQLSLDLKRSDHHGGIRFLGNLFCAAAEREQQTGEKILQQLSSVCRYETFPFNEGDMDQCDVLLDLCTHIKDYETQTGFRVLPSFQSVFQSTPAVWIINLSERKTSILLEVLKLQSEKKPVELTGWTDEDGEVRSFLQCLPYISQLRLSEENFQQVLDLLLEIPDQELMMSRSRFDVDLTSCCLTWDLLHHLLQKSSSQTIIVDLRKNRFLQQNPGRLLPFLDQILFRRPGPVFVKTFIRELYRARAHHMIPSFLRSLDHVISLSCTELDLLDCDGLLFILQHSDVVKLNLMWASIPTERTESIFLRLDRVSHLSVDRNQLLGFIRCCAASSSQQEAASGLLRTLQHKLDLSWSSCVALSEDDQAEPSGLTDGDCRAISTILRCSTQDTQLLLTGWQVKDSGLDLLFPVLDRVRLSVSKPLLLQLLSLVPVNRETDTERRAEFLSRSLGGELDLSHSTLDQRLCAVLNQMMDICEDLAELDLSHCQLTDHLLSLLITQLHKVHVLDLSHNLISDASTDVLLRLVSINPSISSVRLFNNNITNMTAFRRHQQFEIW